MEGRIMTTETLTLTDFLLARISEDEDAARAGISSQADPENGWGYLNEGVSRGALTPHVGIIHEPIQAAHIIRWHPARVLAECEAKRRMVEVHHPLDDDPEPFCWNCDEEVWPCKTMAALVAIYADHPDYNPDWRQ